MMKATGADIAHKTEHGLVRLGVDSAAEARRAYAELVDAAGSDGDGVLVCETVTDGVETVVGIKQDTSSARRSCSDWEACSWRCWKT